jgi:agmatine deiminase
MDMMPAEWEPHALTVMAWPTETRRDELWGEQLSAARRAHAEVARTVCRFEPVLMVADPSDVDSAGRMCGDDIEVWAAPIDDSWLRDSGPIFVRGDDGSRRGVCFGFNAWGEDFSSWARDAEIASLICEHLGIEAVDATDFVLEGGSIAVDGTGFAATTERCLLNDNRGVGRTRQSVEAVLADRLGISKLVWLTDAIVEDDGTDGHVDNVVAFAPGGRALVQGCADRDNPNNVVAEQNRAALAAASMEVIEISHLPYASVGGALHPVPYANFYLCNGGVIVPTVDGGEAAMLDLIGDCFGDRDVAPVPGEILAFGGGGVHCITQQVIS